ncbi:MAG TPA: MAPEG family protein [Xanthobacteraceae bacterium]|nr:MAPEG family protein [Xanthobacteraceae bacterium]
MSTAVVLAPVFAQVLLICIINFGMARMRVGHTRRREVKIRDIALGQDAWPERATQFGNNYRNQFELPVLFFALVAFALIAGKANLLFVVMAWIFVLARYVHAFIHVTSNWVPRRFFAFTVGSITLYLMWLIFAVRIIAGV